ncbi:MAG: prolipoprotein diacylglyceryl transferase [Alphaproteobacteria bacterium]|nr:prolipoprotein diacylglyceryl transferase [Alphaproteobacteria bacterium]
MNLFTFAFPSIDPVLLSIGPIKIHWYGVAYIAGILAGWKYALYLARHYASDLKEKDFDDFVTWIVIAIIVGGRLGHILIYEAGYYFSHPLEILMTWRGGMSFYGGLVGVIIATLIYCKRRSINPFRFADVMAATVPIGIGLGRIANFINGELYGRVTDVPWAVEFPSGGFLPRHPSQLYEAALEGLFLFLMLGFVWHRTQLSKTPGRITGLFLMGYAVSRFLVEYVREPDIVYNVLSLSLTTGQLLALPFFIIGMFWALPKRT